MKILLQLSYLLVFFLFLVQLQAQTCKYRIELFDSFGDGWNGANVTIKIRDSTYVFTLDRRADNGFFRAFEATVMDGDSATLTFNGGSFNAEIRFAVYNPENILIYSASGPLLRPGVPITAILECPTCFVPDPATVKVGDVRAFTAALSWKTPATTTSGTRYLLQYGLKGFRRDTGSVVSTLDTQIVLRNLRENTEYEVYLSSICPGNDTSRAVGPYSFKTLWANNVGVIAINTPESRCGLGAGEKVTLTLKNFGGNPQSLIPFNYSVNGRLAPVSMPQDGLFTGVLGKDSTFVVEFDAVYDFSEPGEYLVAAWTDLEADSERRNDTARATIVSIPNITTFPYFEDFERWGGGWTVSDTSRNPSWQHGQPSKTGINAAAGGQRAWVTSLDTTYNNNELSYLVSPCLNFSSLMQDPRLTFSLNFFTEACCDEGWVEMSFDGGTSWRKIGADTTGVNWYNDTSNYWWDGNGGAEGWRTVSHTLDSARGQANVRIRFVFSSDLSNVDDGMAIDNIFISTPLARDVAVLSAVRADTAVCGSTRDSLRLTIRNFGTTAATGFNVAYSVNGATPIVENVGTFQIAPGAQAVYTFRQPFNSIAVGDVSIVAWASVANEQFRLNDTVRYQFNTTLPVPFAEDFETRRVPQGWQVDSGTGVGNGHGNRSYVIFDNLSTTDRRMEVVTPPIGLIQTGDSLTFQYRITNFTGDGRVATTLGARDSIAVQISTNCGQTYVTKLLINAQTHRPDTNLRRMTIFLNEFAGQAIRIRFLAGWGAGDYYVDLDNINIIRCPASLALTTTIENESARNAADGQATVSAGSGAEPYTYLWSNGVTDKIAAKLTTGTYEVTVTDRFGCSDVATAVVGLSTSLEKIETINKVTLAPNPTSGQTLLKIELREVSEVQVQVFRTNGQLLWQTRERGADRFAIPLDLNNQPAGLYIVRMRVGEQIRAEKLIKF